MHGEIEYSDGKWLWCQGGHGYSSVDVPANAEIKWSIRAGMDTGQGSETVAALAEITISGAQDSFDKKCTFSGGVSTPEPSDSGTYTTKGNCTVTLHVYATHTKNSRGGGRAKVNSVRDTISGKLYKEINGAWIGFVDGVRYIVNEKV